MKMEKSIWDVLEIENSERITKECILTSRILAELKGISRLAGFTKMAHNHICLKEAKASWDLDNEPFDMGDLLKAAISKETPYNMEIAEVKSLRNVLENYSKKIPTVTTLEESASSIYGENITIRCNDENVYLNNGEDIVYKAPEGNKVSQFMDEFIEYLNTQEHRTDELIVTCVAHLIFECIRPFNKGNGLTGRLLIHMLLNRYGLIDGCELMISPSILKNKEVYFRELSKAEKTGKTEDWIIFMLKMIREGAQETLSMIFSIHEMCEEVEHRCQDLPFINHLVLDIAFSNAYCKSSDLINNKIAERVTAMKYLRLLEERGVLESEKVGRELLFKNTFLWKLIQ